MVWTFACSAVVAVGRGAVGSAGVGSDFGTVVRLRVLFVDLFCAAVVLEVSYGGFVSVAVEVLNQILLTFFCRFPVREESDQTI